MMKSRVILVAGTMAASGAIWVAAEPPAWWQERVGLQGEESPKSPATIGQLKNMAHHLHAEMEANLPGGVGFPLTDLFHTAPPLADQTQEWKDAQRAAVTLGQVKHVAHEFYVRLNGFAPAWLDGQFDANGLTDGQTPWPHNFPWDPATPAEVNKQIATLGQLKLVFSLRIAEDENDNDIPDILDQAYYGNLAIDPTQADYDGDGLTDADEFSKYNSSPFLTDTDFDEMPDAWEAEHGLLPGDASDATGDLDQDNLNNLLEFQIGTDPTDKDTDDDYVSDGIEYYGQ